MALNREYFDAIHIDVVKKKYYNANKVEAVLSDIRQQAEAMYEENLAMKEQLDAVNGSKFQIGEAVLAAQAIYREILEKANERAAEIVADAEKRREELLADTLRQQEYAVHQVESFYAQLRRQYEQNMEDLNSRWQSFLCGLYPAEEPEKKQPEKKEAPAKKPEPEGSMELPVDLSEKVQAIARELFSIGGEEPQ